MLHTDIPDGAQVGKLLAHRGAGSVSIYVPTDPASTGEAERIEFKNLAASALDQLRNGGTRASDVADLQEEMATRRRDTFWRTRRAAGHFRHTCVPVTFRCPTSDLQRRVSDRFFVNRCYVP